MSRHPGALVWIRAQKIHFDFHVPHLDIEQISRGDTVIGTLPIHLAARVNERGARYFNLSLEVPAELRGKELSAKTLETFQARLEEFCVCHVHDDSSSSA